MATNVRNLDGLIERQLLVEFNALRRDLARLKNGVLYHTDASTAMTLAAAPLATNTATAIVRANVIKAAYNAHIASTLSATTGQGAHLAVDAANAIAAADATDQTSLETLLNELKTDYNIHRASAVFHHTADAVNAIAAADATTEGTAVTLVNELFTDINLHFAGAFASQAIELVSA